MNARAKITLALDRAENVTMGPGAAPQLQGLGLSLMLLRSRLEAMLPADDEQLDELLAKGSTWLLELRSDPE